MGTRPGVVMEEGLRAPAYTLRAPRANAASAKASPMPRLAPVMITMASWSFMFRSSSYRPQQFCTGASARRDFEDQTGRRAVRVEPIVSADNAPFGGRQLPPAVYDAGGCAQRTRGARGGTHDIHAKFHGRVRVPSEIGRAHV